MGSSLQKKPSRQPQRLAPSREGLASVEDTAQRDEADLPNHLEVRLVRIRVQALRASRIGDPVVIEDEGSVLLVTARHGVLGEVPPSFERVLRQGWAWNGTLQFADPDRPAATIIVPRAR